MRLVVAGTPGVALPSLQALMDSSHEVVAVITRPDTLSGRGRRLQRSPVAEWAQDAGLPILQPPRPRDPAFLAELAAIKPDCCPVIAYGALIPRAALDIPRFGWINLHFSILPAWRGAAPVQHAIMAGDQVTGASTFLIEEGLDTGPVYGVMTEVIRPADTAGELLTRLSVAGAALLVATLDGVESGELIAVPQSSEGVCLAPKVTVEQAEVSWAAPARVIDRLIRSVTPAPGAWTTFRGERLGLGPIRLLDGDDALKPGEIRPGKRSVQVGTAAGPVELGVVRPAGKKEMAAADWARGVRPDAGDVLGTGPASIQGSAGVSMSKRE